MWERPVSAAGPSRGAASWIVRVLGRRLWMVGALVAFDVALAAASVYSAWVLRDLVNAAVGADADALFANVALFAAISVTVIAVQAVRRFVQERARSMFQNALKERFLHAVLGADLAAAQTVHTGEWMSRLTDDSRIVADGAATVVSSAAGMLTQLVGSLVLLAAMVPQIAWLLIPAGVVFAAFTLGFRRVLKRLHKQIREADGRSRSYLTECLGSLLVVKSFQREDYAERQAAKLLDEHRAARMRHNRFSNLCNVGFGAAMRGAYLFAVTYCGYGILHGTVSYGTFVGALQLVGQVQGPIANITGCIPKYFAMTASAERLMEAEGLPRDGHGAGALGGRLSGAAEKLESKSLDEFVGIELRDVTCRYVPVPSDEFLAGRDETPLTRENGVLMTCGKGVPPISGEGALANPLAPDTPDSRGRLVRCPDMRIDRGEFVVFTGPSGCGKSTTLKAMMAFYVAQTGACDVLLRDGAREPLTVAWRSLFAYVPQGNHLMSGTVREAVAFGDDEAARDDGRVWDALRVACADFVDDLPQGIDTPLGEGGAGLSEGQVQRLAIARAVFADRPVLLLDEATSSLDPDNERRVLRNLRELPGKTVVAVTHRPAALEVCDKQVEFGGLNGAVCL